MFAWIHLLFRRPQAALSLPPAETSSPPPWVEALIDAVQKSSRAQARLALSFEDVQLKLEGGFAELRSILPHRESSDVRWTELLDAIDLLDEAIQTEPVCSAPEVCAGLRGIVQRMEAFLQHQGLKRVAPSGVLPDGRLFRVVGTQSSSHLPEGVVARVVRAAILRGDGVIREGEVLTSRSAGAV